jgi:hypothetical protein
LTLEPDGFRRYPEPEALPVDEPLAELSAVLPELLDPAV